MKDVDETINPSDPYATVSAFVDGEAVDLQLLKDALAESAARDYLGDLLALREAVGAMAPLDWSATRPARKSEPRPRWLATAAAVLLSLAVGYIAGQRTFDPGVSAQTVEAMVQLERAPAAPKPTRIITLRPGVNWTETTGGR